MKQNDEIMMISEIVNSLAVTYLATEYLTSSQASLSLSSWWSLLLQNRSNVIALVAIVIIINIFDRISGATHAIRELFDELYHIPIKPILVALAYVFTLYVDCRYRCDSKLQFNKFIKNVGVAFLYVLPVYPFLAVLISFGFLIVINIFEFFNIPLSILNWPIYYGTLYGPFSFVYWKVKERVVQEKYSLPSSTAAMD